MSYGYYLNGCEHYKNWYDDESDDDFEDVIFYRPDGTTEGKYVKWCRDNGFFHIHDNVWSGNWYYEHFPEQRPKKCPVLGCQKTFRTDADVEKHVRLTNGKAHNRYKAEHGIISGLTDEEKRKEREEEEERAEREKQMEIGELLDTIYGGDCYCSYQMAQAKKRLREIEEQDYEVICPVKGCNRRFQTEDDLYQEHLRDATGKAHKKEKDIFERRFHYSCPVDGCSERFETESDGHHHLYVLGDNDNSADGHNQALKELRKGFLDFKYLYEPDDSQTRITDYFLKKKKSREETRDAGSNADSTNTMNIDLVPSQIR